jgi:zinc protease
MQASKRQQQIIKIAVITFSLLIVPLVLFFLSLSLPAKAATPKHYTDLTFPPLAAVRIPKYTQFKLPNGITVYLMEDHELPLVGGTALFRTGKRFEPAEKTGLAELTGWTLRAGGTRQHPAEALNQILEEQAAAIETFVGMTAGGSGFFSLSEDLDQVLGLFAEVLREPVFAPAQVELMQKQQRGRIARRNDDPDSILGREFQKLVYGATSPYARTTEYATLANISRDDVIQFHQQYFRPQGMLLGIVGDFDSKTVRSQIEAQFGTWVAASSPKLERPPVQQAEAGKVFLVDQPQLNQSYVQIGHLGGQLNSPDYAALEVMNQAMNGFGGRLFNALRSRQGLAYSVYASWGPQFDYPGVFVAGGQTRSGSTVPLIQGLRSQIDLLRTTPLAPKELAFAKDSVLNAFVFNFQDPGQTLSRLLWYEYYDYPTDFIFQFQKAVKATTIADVQHAAQTHLKPNQFVMLVVGSRTQIEPPLDILLQPGEQVTALDITIPGPDKRSALPAR